MGRRLALQRWRGDLNALAELEALGGHVFHREEDALRRWLAGEWIRPAQVRGMQERLQEFADERMRAAGIEPYAGNIADLGQEIYGAMSSSSHHERGGFPESIAIPLRKFAYGPHPDPERRASHLAFAGELLEETLLVVGGALRDLIGGSYYADFIQPLQAHLVNVRAEYPLPD